MNEPGAGWRIRSFPWLASALAVAACSGCAAPEATVDPFLEEAIAWYTGVAGRVDDDRARALLMQAAQDDDPISRMWIARVHSRGRMGFEEDRETAARIAAEAIGAVRSAAEAGINEAVFLMGTAHAEGLGVPEDAEQAVQWYRRAAEAGHVLAQHNMGNVYRDGVGVPTDAAAAVRWWTPAAESGDAIAQLRLGESLEHGRGVDADTAMAIRWYRDAARRGNPAASEAVRRLTAAGPGG